jgi:hypothetical protein
MRRKGLRPGSLRRLSLPKLALLTILLGLCAVPQLEGTITPCKKIDESGAKVVLSMIGYSGDPAVASTTAKELNDAFYFGVGSSLRSIYNVTGAVKPDIAQCLSRQPALDRSDFTSDAIEALNEKDVLLEVWGDISTTTVDSKKMFEAVLCFMLIPVCKHTGESEGVGSQTIRYSLESSEPPREFIKRLSSRTEVAVFYLLGSGVKALKNRDYDTAQNSLCTAYLLIAQAEEQNRLGEWMSDVQELKVYMISVVREIRTKARADTNYHGLLKSLPEVVNDNDICK